MPTWRDSYVIGYLFIVFCCRRARTPQRKRKQLAEARVAGSGSNRDVRGYNDANPSEFTIDSSICRHACEEKKKVASHAATCYTAVYKHVRTGSLRLCINSRSLFPPYGGTSAASVGSALAQ